MKSGYRAALSFAAKLVLFAGLSCNANAQPADAGRITYTDACWSQRSGDTRGHGIRLTRTGNGYATDFLDYWVMPANVIPVEARISGDKISFEVGLDAGKLPVRFAGTITPDEVRGRFSNDLNREAYNAEVRWVRSLPGAPWRDCR